jgi:MoxR-like ATPase
MELGELADRAKSPTSFEEEEVRQRIEQFNERDLEAFVKNHPGTVRSLVDDLRQLQKDMKEDFVDRDKAVEMALTCFLAHVNMVFLGEPGTAKSLVVRRLSYGLGLQGTPVTIDELNEEARQWLTETQQSQKDQAEPQESVGRNGHVRRRGYFEVLLTRYSTSDEILGPAHLKLMLNRAIFLRQTNGLLPEAQVAFLDEIWKANSAILNALLSISNERLFYNAGRPVRVPLCMIYGASNEIPREEELGAMYDRFPIRVICLRVDDSPSLLKKSGKEAFRNVFGGAESIPRRATTNHFRLLFRVVHGYFGKESRADGNGPFPRAFCETFDALKREFRISDRSLHSLYRAACALALLRDHKAPEATELDVFKYCFYEPETSAALCDAVDQRIQRYRKM